MQESIEATLITERQDDAAAPKSRKPREKPKTFATVKELDALKPEAAPYEVQDTIERGLRCVIRPSGARSFVWRFRFDGQARRDKRLWVRSNAELLGFSVSGHPTTANLQFEQAAPKRGAEFAACPLRIESTTLN